MTVAPRLRIVKVTGAAGIATVKLQPDEGFYWRVISAFASHNDTAARNCSWQFYDGTYTMQFSAYSTAQNTKHVLGGSGWSTGFINNMLSKIYVTSQCYLQFNAALIDPTYVINAYALVVEFEGVYPGADSRDLP